MTQRHCFKPFASLLAMTAALSACAQWQVEHGSSRHITGGLRGSTTITMTSQANTITTETTTLSITAAAQANTTTRETTAINTKTTALENTITTEMTSVSTTANAWSKTTALTTFVSATATARAITSSTRSSRSTTKTTIVTTRRTTKVPRFTTPSPDCHGGDISPIVLASSLQECQEKCAAYAGCKFITFSSGAVYPGCWLKSGLTGTKCSACDVHGFCTTTGACDPTVRHCSANIILLQANTAMTETVTVNATATAQAPIAISAARTTVQIPRFTTPSPDCHGGDISPIVLASSLHECQEKCAAYAGCKFITFSAGASSPGCWLKNGLIGTKCSACDIHGFCTTTGVCDPTVSHCSTNIISLQINTSTTAPTTTTVQVVPTTTIPPATSVQATLLSKCAASYGAVVGDAVCCGQPGTLHRATHICGASAPICTGYIRSQQWGICVQVATYVQFGTGACLGQNSAHGPNSWYVKQAGFIGTLRDCQSICDSTPNCRAVEYHLGYTKHCEIWTTEPQATSGELPWTCMKKMTTATATTTHTPTIGTVATNASTHVATTTTLMIDIQGALSFVAPGATASQVVTGARGSLANEFQVAKSQVMALASQSHRIEQSTLAFSQRRAGNWLVQYVVTIHQSQVWTSKIKLEILSSNISAFSESLKAELINAEVSSAVLANFGITNFAGSVSNRAIAATIAATTTAVQAVTTKTTITTATTTAFNATTVVFNPSNTSTSRASAPTTNLALTTSSSTIIVVSQDPTSQSDDNLSSIALNKIALGSSLLMLVCCCCSIGCCILRRVKGTPMPFGKTFRSLSSRSFSTSSSSKSSLPSCTSSFLSIASLSLTSRYALPKGKSYHYFISHKKRHSRLGNVSEMLSLHLHDHLQKLGWRGFFDVDDLQEISKAQLRRHIWGSCSMIVVLSDETVDSDWCCMEWREAEEKGIPVVCVVDLKRFEQPKILQQVGETSEYLLKYQWIDYTDKYRRESFQHIEQFLVRVMTGRIQLERMCPSDKMLSTISSKPSTHSNMVLTPNVNRSTSSCNSIDHAEATLAAAVDIPSDDRAADILWKNDMCRCITLGCSRPTWNGTPGGLCCQTCGVNAGRCHGEACDQNVHDGHDGQLPALPKDASIGRVAGSSSEMDSSVDLRTLGRGPIVSPGVSVSLTLFCVEKELSETRGNAPLRAGPRIMFGRALALPASGELAPFF